MALTNAFYEAVNSGNVRRVRIIMKNSLLVDPTFHEFYEMEKAASSMEGLYDEHDGKEFIEDKSQWNDDYMDKMMVKVLSNFSHERIEHIKNVVRYLRPVAKKVAPKTHETNIGIGAVAGAAVGGVIASMASASVAGVIGSIAAGAVVGGVATAIIINGGK